LIDDLSVIHDNIWENSVMELDCPELALLLDQTARARARARRLDWWWTIETISTDD
jgi:hypothetical protein